jgi:hypothetical protein
MALFLQISPFLSFDPGGLLFLVGLVCLLPFLLYQTCCLLFLLGVGRAMLPFLASFLPCSTWTPHRTHRHSKWRLTTAFPTSFLLLSSVSVSRTTATFLGTLKITAVTPAAHQLLTFRTVYLRPFQRCRRPGLSHSRAGHFTTYVSSRQLCLEYRTLLNDFKLCRFSGLLDPSLAYFDHPQYDLERILPYGPWEDDPTIVPSFSPPVEPLYVVDSRLASALSTRHLQQLFDSALLQHNMVSEIRHAHSSDNVCSPLLRPGCATASIAGGTLPYDTLYSHRSTPWSMGYSPPSSLHCAYAHDKV